MYDLKKSLLFSCASLALFFPPDAFASTPEKKALSVVKSIINTESDNAEACLEFDAPLATPLSSDRGSSLVLETGGKQVTKANIAAKGSSLCVFPLERNVSYRLTIKGFKSINGDKMSAAYSQTFKIPDRSPSLSFTREAGNVNEFGSYETPLTLRAINIPKTDLAIYRVTDAPLMAKIWHERALNALAPSESIYHAKKFGSSVWREELPIGSERNLTVEQTFSLKEKIPDLPPGVYLIVAETKTTKKKPARKGLEPLAATWFVKSAFALRSVQDDDGIHAFLIPSGQEDLNVQITAFDPEGTVRAQGVAQNSGANFISHIAKTRDKKRPVTLIAADDKGNVAFADIEDLRAFSLRPDPDALKPEFPVVFPMSPVNVLFSPPISRQGQFPKTPGTLQIMRDETVLSKHTVPILTGTEASLSVFAPAFNGQMRMRWIDDKSNVLAESVLRVSDHPQSPRLEATTECPVFTIGQSCDIKIRSLSDADAPVPFTGGKVSTNWQRLDGKSIGLEGFHFGTLPPAKSKPAITANFLTDEAGFANVRLIVPPPPSEYGLYQAVLSITAEPDKGVADALPLIVPLRISETVVGLKPLAQSARFAQNSLARFALVALGPDGKKQNLTGLSYQVYEEGRSFDWHQDQGRWKYKKDPLLRPIGSGEISIREQADSFLEWPVATGNYRLEVFDKKGQTLAEVAFSAGWDAADYSVSGSSPLSVSLPKEIAPQREAVARVKLDEPSFITMIVSDSKVRKVYHEARPKGEAAFSFTPDIDWLKTVHIHIEATPSSNPQRPKRRFSADVPVISPANAERMRSAQRISIGTNENPSAMTPSNDEIATFDIAVRNHGPSRETYRYAFTASQGLKKLTPTNGTFELSSNQGKNIPVSISGSSSGKKELTLEVVGRSSNRAEKSWPLAIIPKHVFLQSQETVQIASRAPLPPAKSPISDGYALLSRRPMNGLPEVLSAFVNINPFTTEELASTIQTLQTWKAVLNDLGLMPDFVATARKEAYTLRLLRHQNPDGGFGELKDDESAIKETAAALVALWAMNGAETTAARENAILWIKSQLSNTWFDEADRDERAAAISALATVGALDPASLHYFSDTSAKAKLSPVAKAQIAGAFKSLRDPDAAALWTKKMIDEDGRPRIPALLKALASTYALSSDDVLAATSEMAGVIHADLPLEPCDITSLLHAIDANNALAGKGHISDNTDTRSITGVLVLPATDVARFRNKDDTNLFLTYVSKEQRRNKFTSGHKHLTRRIYKLNGIEVPSTTKPVRGEPYIIEINGSIPASRKSMRPIVVDTASGLRPKGCPLSANHGTLSFIPWISTHELSPILSCETSPNEIRIALPSSQDNTPSFKIIYLTEIESNNIGDLPLPKLRFIDPR